MIIHLLVQLGLDRIEQGAIDDGRLLARKGLALEHHLANVEAVAEKIGKRTPGERNAAYRLPGLQGRALVTMPRLRRSAISRLRLPSLR